MARERFLICSTCSRFLYIIKCVIFPPRLTTHAWRKNVCFVIALRRTYVNTSAVCGQYYTCLKLQCNIKSLPFAKMDATMYFVLKNEVKRISRRREERARELEKKRRRIICTCTWTFCYSKYVERDVHWHWQACYILTNSLCSLRWWLINFTKPSQHILSCNDKFMYIPLHDLSA